MLNLTTLTFVLAGSDTVCLVASPMLFTYAYHDQTVSTMSSLFLALLVYPEVQKRARAELDAVIARDRLPTFDDRPRLPYIDALCRELLRWQMVTPLGSCSRSQWPDSRC